MDAAMKSCGQLAEFCLFWKVSPKQKAKFTATIRYCIVPEDAGGRTAK
jgi:hypothetical protein